MGLRGNTASKIYNRALCQETIQLGFWIYHTCSLLLLYAQLAQPSSSLELLISVPRACLKQWPQEFFLLDHPTGNNVSLDYLTGKS